MMLAGRYLIPTPSITILESNNQVLNNDEVEAPWSCFINSEKVQFFDFLMFDVSIHLNFLFL